MMTGIAATGSGTTPALREVLSGKARETTSKIDSLNQGIQGLRDHVDMLDRERSKAEAELSKHVTRLQKCDRQLKLSLPAIIAGAVLGICGGTAGVILSPCVATVAAVVAGSALIGTGGILATTGRMNQTESHIMGGGARDRVEMFDNARQKALAHISSKEREIEALRQQEADLLKRVQAEAAQPIAPGVILMEPETVRIGGLLVPRRLGA